MKTIKLIFAVFLLTSISTEIRAQSNSKPSTGLGSNVPNPNSDDKAAQIQNTPHIIDDSGEKVYFLANPSTKDQQPVQQPVDRSSNVPAKGNAKNDPE